MNDIGVVIVTYNSGGEIGACLDALTGSGAEIVVIDNASSDNTAAEVALRGAALIRNAENRGFAAAVNQGFRALSASYVLLLNPDAHLRSGLSALRAQCELPGVAAAGGQTVHPDGRPQTGWMVRRLPTPAALCFEVLLINRLWPGNPVNWRFRCYDLDLTQAVPLDVEQPAGAFLMIRRDAWERLGGFDEQFHPLWFEDVDFCRRLTDCGLLLRYVPEAVASHTGGHSIDKMPLGFREIYWYGSLLKYAAKHFSPVHRRLVCCSVVAGSVIRGMCKLFHRGGWQELPVYRKVIGLAARHFLSRNRCEY